MNWQDFFAEYRHQLGFDDEDDLRKELEEGFDGWDVFDRVPESEDVQEDEA